MDDGIAQNAAARMRPNVIMDTLPLAYGPNWACNAADEVAAQLGAAVTHAVDYEQPRDEDGPQ